MAEDPTPLSKKDKIARIIQALQSKGHQISDEDLGEMQLKTDALLRAAAGDHEHHSDHSKAE